MPCPHFEMTVISRGKNQSAVEKAAYQSGEKLYSEWDHRTKYYKTKETQYDAPQGVSKSSI